MVQYKSPLPARAPFVRYLSALLNMDSKSRLVVSEIGNLIPIVSLSFFICHSVFGGIACLLTLV